MKKITGHPSKLESCFDESKIRTVWIERQAPVPPGDLWCWVSSHATFYQSICVDGGVLVDGRMCELNILCKITMIIFNIVLIKITPQVPQSVKAFCVLAF